MAHQPNISSFNICLASQENIPTRSMGTSGLVTIIGCFKSSLTNSLPTEPTLLNNK